jgi:hypothetical protein
MLKRLIGRVSLSFLISLVAATAIANLIYSIAAKDIRVRHLSQLALTSPPTVSVNARCVKRGEPFSLDDVVVLDGRPFIPRSPHVSTEWRQEQGYTIPIDATISRKERIGVRFFEPDVYQFALHVIEGMKASKAAVFHIDVRDDLARKKMMPTTSVKFPQIYISITTVVIGFLLWRFRLLPPIFSSLYLGTTPISRIIP